MKQFHQLFLLASTVLYGRASATPISSPGVNGTIVQPGGLEDVIITAQNTLNGTTYNPNPLTPAAAAGALPLEFVNKFKNPVHAYVTGLDANNAVVMLQPNGQFYYPNAQGSGTPVPITADCSIKISPAGTTSKITIPSYISSARVYVAEAPLKFYVVASGSGQGLVEPAFVNPHDPNANVSWGFVELTNTQSSGLYVNLSYVDFVGLLLGISVQSTSGQMQNTPGLKKGALSSICSSLTNEARASKIQWDNLCYLNSKGVPLRALAPFDYLSGGATTFNSYYRHYVNLVWARYEKMPLIINTQGSAGKVACKVTGRLLQCAGDNRGYAKPTAADIFGCNSGPFAIQSGDNGVHQAVVPRLCAAFARSTLLMKGGSVQPSLPASDYYKVFPTNYYSKYVHEHEVNGEGYAFAYDDVNPVGESASGLLVSSNPAMLRITVGGA